MQKVILSLLVLTLFFSCNPTTETDSQTATEESVETPAPADDTRFVAIDSDEALITTALMAAPKASREESTVIGYNMAGEFVTLKEGSNEFICLADNPKQEGFNAACYHKDLEPFMARGRALKAEGKSASEIFDIREQEAKAGTLDMGEAGSTLHIYYGPEASYDPATGEVANAIYRYVVYMPWATAASTGLPERPVAPNHPWIMNPGTHRAHIMISPVNEGE
ncbi:MAG TPA: hypothetical protein VJ953_09215 [Saprospiraceae bacterium]|nr:hypothetical protein [Saprospiraceae bacterium]